MNVIILALLCYFSPIMFLIDRPILIADEDSPDALLDQDKSKTNKQAPNSHIELRKTSDIPRLYIVLFE